MKSDPFHLDLQGLSQPLREHAKRQGLSIASAARLAISQMLDSACASPGSPRVEASDGAEDTDRGTKGRLQLSMVPARIEMLTARARACGVSRSLYVEMLMDGAQPVTLPGDHAAMVSALMASTDHLAVLSCDLRAFMRLFGMVPAQELEVYRTRLRGLVDDVMAHLELAAKLLLALEATRRWR